MHSEVHHPDLAGIPKIAALLGKGSKGGLSSLLMPNPSALARRRETDTQVLLVPVSQRFGIMRPEEKSTDSGDYFPCRSRPIFSRCLCSLSRTCWQCGRLCRHREFTLGQNKAGAESVGQDLK